MFIESPQLQQYQEIPKKFTCQGENVSPPLVFHEIPKDVRSFTIR